MNSNNLLSFSLLSISFAMLAKGNHYIKCSDYGKCNFKKHICRRNKTTRIGLI